MPLFKKKTLNVDDLRLEQNYNKLIKLLNHKDQSIVHKAEKALCQLVNVARNLAIEDYDRMLKKLESDKVLKSKTAIEPFIQRLKIDRNNMEKIEQIKQTEIEKFTEKVEQTGFSYSSLRPDDKENLHKILLPDEKFEYYFSAGLGSGSGSVSTFHYLLTDRKLIFLDLGLVSGNIEYVKYDNITSLERSLTGIKIYVGEKVVNEIPKSWATWIIPHLSRFISLDESIKKKFIPKPYHENPQLYALRLKNLKDPCIACGWSIKKGKSKCVECGKIFYSLSESKEVKEVLDKKPEYTEPKNTQKTEESPQTHLQEKSRK